MVNINVLQEFEKTKTEKTSHLDQLYIVVSTILTGDVARLIFCFEWQNQVAGKYRITCLRREFTLFL